MNIEMTKLNKCYRNSLPVSYVWLGAGLDLPTDTVRLYTRHLNLALTFFFGRFTSSFIEAHLFKVLSRLKHTQKRKKTKLR